MPDATERSYPANAPEWYAEKSGIAEGDLVVGQHIGKTAPGGTSPAGAFDAAPQFSDGYKPFHRVDNPTDGWNDGADFVVYFVDSSSNVYKATNADISTLAQLTSGDEYDAVVGYKPASI